MEVKIHLDFVNHVAVVLDLKEQAFNILVAAVGLPEAAHFLQIHGVEGGSGFLGMTAPKTLYE
jgi:hypothetical protein